LEVGTGVGVGLEVGTGVGAGVGLEVGEMVVGFGVGFRVGKRVGSDPMVKYFTSPKPYSPPSAMTFSFDVSVYDPVPTLQQMPSP